MEAQKEFHFNDAFYIAERLDAIQNALPIPPHDEKEFHSKDNYIIWTKLSPAIPPAFNDYHGQVYTISNQTLVAPAPIVWSFINESNGVSFVGSSVSVTNAGIYRLDYTATLKNIDPAGVSDGFSIYKNGIACGGSNFESEPITPVDFIRSIAGQCMLSINPGDVIEVRSTLRSSRIFASNLFSSRASMQIEKIQ